MQHKNKNIKQLEKKQYKKNNNRIPNGKRKEK